MKKILLIVGLLILLITEGSSQTDPLYAQYLSNPLLINPAYTGLNNKLSIAAGFRKQWTGFQGSPETYNATVHSSLRDQRMGLGLSVLSDKIGVSKNSEVNATYAYRLPLNEMTLSFGLQAGIMNFRSDNGDLNPYDPTDPTFAQNGNLTKFNVGTGAILHNDKFFLGLSVPRLIDTKASIEGNTTALYQKHYYMTAAYIVPLSELLSIKPSVLIRGTAGAKASADLNVTLNVNDRFYTGLFTRNFNTYGGQLQLRYNEQYRIGYVFEIPSSKTLGTQFVSHEAVITIDLAAFRFQQSDNLHRF